MSNCAKCYRQNVRLIVTISDLGMPEWLCPRCLAAEIEDETEGMP